MKSVFIIDDNGQGMEEVGAFLRERGYSVTECGPESGDALRFTRFALDRACVQVFWIIESGRFIYVNDATCNTLGYTREELTRMSVSDIDPYFPSEEGHLFDDHWRMLRENGYARFETCHRAKDGRVYPVEIQSNFLEFEGREYCCSFATDISERKRAEEKLLLHEFFIEKAAIGIFQTSIDGQIITANERACRSLGYTCEELLAMSVFDIDPAITSEKILEIKGMLDAHGSATHETIHRRKDGTTFPVEIAVNRLEFHGNSYTYSFVQDISERKRGEQALRESEARLKLAMETARLVQWEFDVATGMFRFDDQFYTLYGTSVDREGGTLMSADAYVRKFVHPDDISIVIAEIERAVTGRDRTATGQVEHRIIRADGEERFISVRYGVVCDQKGRVVKTRGANQDITERKRAEEERKNLEGQLHQARKMEAVGQLAGGIAHDFNNILTAIMGFAEVMLMRMEHGNLFQHHVMQILAAAERAADLTRGLLAFSRKQVLHIRALKVHEVVDGVKKMLRRLVPEDIDFRVKTAAPGLTVMADKGQIEQVLMNLVTNARDSMPMGGVLTIEVDFAFIDEGFIKTHGFGIPGRYARIGVEDTGCGMDEETREKIFEPFFTTKMIGKGTGLGLSIIYGIIKQHNGFITVDSSPGRGTTFCVFLPLVAQEKQGLSERLRPEPAPAPGGSETILLAEDDDVLREMNRAILEEAGYTVIEATDGREALDIFTVRGSSVDILVTDVIMPNMDGKRLCEEIMGIRPAMKVLFMSGYSTDILDGRGVVDDGINFIPKPVMPSELLKRLREILDRT